MPVPVPCLGCLPLAGRGLVPQCPFPRRERLLLARLPSAAHQLLQRRGVQKSSAVRPSVLGHGPHADLSGMPPSCDATMAKVCSVCPSVAPARGFDPALALGRAWAGCAAVWRRDGDGARQQDRSTRPPRTGEAIRAIPRLLICKGWASRQGGSPGAPEAHRSDASPRDIEGGSCGRPRPAERTTPPRTWSSLPSGRPEHPWLLLDYDQETERERFGGASQRRRAGDGKPLLAARVSPGRGARGRRGLLRSR